MQKPKISSILVAGAITLGLAGVSAGAIHASTTNSNNPVSSLVNEIASKFNLNPSDVQQVFDQHHAQMEAQHLQNFKDQLTQAVKDGKLTQDQMDKILAKQQELKAQADSNKTAFEGKTPQEIRALIEAQRTALDQWAKDNNIPTQYLRFGFGGGRGHMGRGFGMHGRMMGGQDNDKELPTTTNNQ